MHTGHAGLLTHVKKDLLNHLKLSVSMGVQVSVPAWVVPEQSADDTVLISPFRRVPLALTFRDSLEEFAFFLCFAVYGVEWQRQ